MRIINLCHKFKSPATLMEGESRKDSSHGLSNRLNVSEEYLQTFRTQSYVEMCDKVQGQLSKTTTSSGTSTSTVSPIPNFYLDLSKSLLEPRQETLHQIINENSNFHQLLVDYFEASLKACNICELILQSIHQTRSDNKRIKKVIKIITKRILVQDCDDNDDDDDDDDDDQQYYCQVIFRELTKFSKQKNPFSIISPIQFHDIHDGYLTLLQRLTSKYKKVKRKARLYRFCKRVGAAGLVISHSALLIALLIFALHSVFGIIAAPAIMACALFGLYKKKKMELLEAWLSTRVLEGLSEQLDVAAKGVFILINDFDTMSRMIGRLHDEIEHRKSIADICVRNGKSCELLRKVVKEFCANESSFFEQLEELEAHIYLCLLTMNRSRRLVIQGIMENQ